MNWNTEKSSSVSNSLVIREWSLDGSIETEEAFQKWFINEVRKGMPSQREEQLSIPIEIMPNGDTAGARGAAIEAQRVLLFKA